MYDIRNGVLLLGGEGILEESGIRYQVSRNRTREMAGTMNGLRQCQE